MTTTPATTSLVRLSVGPFAVGLDMGRVFGIERAERIKPAADRPDLAGRIVNRVGEWPVLDLATCLGFETPAARTGQVVLVTLAGERCGLLVDHVSPIARPAAADVRPVPRSLARRNCFFDGVLMLDGRPLLLLDPDRLADPSAAPDDEPAPRKTTRKKRRADRLLVIAQAEYPLPGGRVVGLGLPAGCVLEILEAPDGAAVPGAAAHVREMSRWRDGPLAVIDPAAWCGLRTPPTAGRRVAVVRTPTGEPIGLLTGPAVRMLPLPLPHMPARRPISLTDDRVVGVFDTTEQTLVIPDLTKLAV